MSYRDSDQIEVGEKLRSLKEAMQNVATPERVETALVAAFRQHAAGAPRRRPVAWPRWVLAAGIAAVILLAITAGLFRDQPAPAPPPVPVATVSTPPLPLPAAPPKVMPVQPNRVVRRVAPPPAKPTEIATDFIPVVDPAAWQPGDSAQMLRVRLPRSSLSSFGLPANASAAWEPVRADVIVGRDGIVRAIRFVH